MNKNQRKVLRQIETNVCVRAYCCIHQKDIILFAQNCFPLIRQLEVEIYYPTVTPNLINKQNQNSVPSDGDVLLKS